MYRREFIKVLSSAASVALLGCVRTQKEPPNVILLVTDDQGYGDLACHGNPWLQTPAMDALHASSVRLTNFHVGPTCAPTRASLMTGRYSNRTGVWHTVMGRSLLRRDEVTMADVFQANGYVTGMFGKWHLGDSFPFEPYDRGFDETVAHGGGGVGQTPDYWDNDYFDDTYFHNGIPQKHEGYCTDIWFNESIKFIENHKEHPFLCYLATNAPHGPYHVDDKYSQPYKQIGVPESRACFYGMISNIDGNLAILREKLDQLGLSENTIFIFMTDNGSANGLTHDSQGFMVEGYNGGMRGKKGSEYDGGHRVPCFIYWPKGKLDQGRDIEQITAHVDLLPTLIELCGLSGPSVQFDGKSLKSLLYNESNWTERILVTDSQRIENPKKWRKSAVMTENWRLVNGRELYAIKSDPEQRNDVAEINPQIVEKLRTEYEKWWQSVSERFDEFCPIVIGESDEVVTLTSHDWHDVEIPDADGRMIVNKNQVPPWNQSYIRSGQCKNGFWVIDVAKSGTYEFELRRWPRESGLAIGDGLPQGDAMPGGSPKNAGKVLHPVNARIRADDVEKTAPVDNKAQTVRFRLNLEKGEKQLKTWFIEKNGVEYGAYYVYVRKVDDL